MSRTYKDMPQYKWIDRKTGMGLWGLRWNSAGIGKWYKRRYHKLCRKYWRGTGGRERSIVRWGSEVNWKGW